MAVERLTVAQAAAQLGVSQDAIRKRVRRGTIRYDQDPGGLIHVYVDPSKTSRDESNDASMERLVQAQRDDIEFLRRELETRTEEIRRRDSILAALTQRLPEIEAPGGPPPTIIEGAVEEEPGVERPTGSREEDGSGGARKARWRSLITVAVLLVVAGAAWLTSLLVAMSLLYP